MHALAWLRGLATSAHSPGGCGRADGWHRPSCPQLQSPPARVQRRRAERFPAPPGCERGDARPLCVPCPLQAAFDGKEQDVEGCFAQGAYWVVQSRPQVLG